MSGPQRVVITGIGLVTPIGTGVEDFWKQLIAGESGVRTITSFDPSFNRVRIAAEVPDFDPARWLEYKDVRRFDRVGHLAVAAAELTVADQALDGLDRDEIAAIVGCGLGGTRTAQTGIQDQANGRNVSPLFIPMAMANFAASTVAFRHQLGGPCYAPLSACSSSADAVGQGYRMVRDGHAVAALVGGAEAAVNPVVLSGFTSMRALSKHNDDPQGACRPFSKDRDGFVLGEGAGMLLLETLDSARARDAHIYAEVCGYGQVVDTHHVTAPREDGACAARAMTLAMREAGVAPDEVGYINAHGTGTLLSDPAETNAVHRAFGAYGKRVPISSTKAMTGHMLGATGAVEAAICALAIDRGTLPPTINYNEPDPACEVDCVPNVARTAKVEVALSNSIAFGGHNVTLAFRRVED
ncbi:beta-ketoacyl-ACP synthase II [Nocardia yamanashiensis]|uniref:beta-ketoacyl-ACP synthase II n=1 Tax=Nocardia yamanashiensis TaxID=209247 RepID=UPI001E5BEA46|nr:beta-ketoacyl-ACP synthase II [Nocardia yamanashiensis]UGT41923.1 beta-ketoacyl-ACP synthase II [Nocardia yamanashiensis]